jgi:integrase/recombinase XerC
MSLDTALRSLFGWLHKKYQISDPMGGIDKPKAGTPRLKAVLEDDLKKLISALVGKNDPGSIRDLAIILFLADSGCRSAGLRHLKLTDVDLERKRAVLREKGDRERSVTFTEFTLRALVAWLRIRPANAPTLFCGFYGKHYGQPLQETSLNQMLKRRARQCNLEDHILNPHSFRHRAVKEMLRNGMSTAAVAQASGHRSVEVTEQVYGQLAESERFQLHDDQGPLTSLSSWLADHARISRQS